MDRSLAETYGLCGSDGKPTGFTKVTIARDNCTPLRKCSLLSSHTQHDLLSFSCRLTSIFLLLVSRSDYDDNNESARALETLPCSVLC